MKYVVISDLQVPYHDPKAVNALVEFVSKTRPDGLLCVGDELDAPQPSRWNKGSAGEYAADLHKDIDACGAIMADFRKALGKDKPFHVMRSNHGDRIDTYVNRYAPALSPFLEPGGVLDVAELLGYDDLDITFHRKPFEFATGWLLAHGDESSLSRVPGCTAKNLAVKWGKSVVCGHTHSMGAVAHTWGLESVGRTVWGIEVGNLMDRKKASYLKSGVADWQQGFGIVHVDETNPRRTYAELRPIVAGKVAGE